MDEAVAAFIRSRLPVGYDLRVKSLRGIPGGSSRETFACECLVTDERGQGAPLSLILRRDPPPAAAILYNDRGAEHRLLNRIAERTSIPVPRSLFLDESGDALGRPAMLIERIAGNSDLAALADATPMQLEAIAIRLCEILAELHTTPIEVLDPDREYRDPRNEGIDPSSWDAYMSSTLGYLRRSYASIAFDPLPMVYDIVCSLPNRLPAPAPLVFTHGDFQPTNVIRRDGAVAAVIDWENAHIGDPREDIGWLAQIQFLTGIDLIGAVTVDGGFLGHYTKLTGIPVTPEEVRFFQLFTATAMGTPIIASVKRRLDDVHGEFRHVALLQSIIAGMPFVAALMEYPPPEGAPA